MDQRIEKWSRWIEGPIRDGIVTMHFHRQIWRGIREIVLDNGSLPDSAFWAYHRQLYSATQSMALRRQADEHPDVASLAKLICEIGADPERLTRTWWVGLWDDPGETAYASRLWDTRYGGEIGDYIDPARSESDLSQLKASVLSVARWADQRIAHADRRPVAAEAGFNFEELNDAIDLVGSMFRRYFTLLTASEMTHLEPILSGDWRLPFTVPWIAPDGPHR